MDGSREQHLDVLVEHECWRLLGRKSVGRLAVSIQNQPDIFPVNYRLDGRTLVIKTAPGLKLAAATLGDAVAFEVDALDETIHTGWSVVVRGTATEIESLDELLEADRLDIETWAGGSRNRYLRVTPTHVTGRRIPVVLQGAKPLAAGSRSPGSLED